MFLIDPYRFDLGDPLWNLAGLRPSLDLRFAENKSLVDATTGQNLITFTRASSGTYVDSTGTIRTATTNLLLRSEEFNDASWTKSGSTPATVTANDIASPTGTITGDRINATTISGGVYRSVTVVANVPVTLSGYIKAGTNINQVLFRDDFDAGRHLTVRLSDGAIIGTAGDVTSSSSVAVGNGWYRIVMTYTPTSTQVRWWLRNDTNNSGDFYLWGAQLEQSSTVGEYVPTTSTINSAPRFDHNPVTGESLGLLVEEQRTNLATQSQAFAAAPYALTNGTIANNQLTAPNGTNTAALFLETATTGGHNIGRVGSADFIPVASGTTYTFTVFVKSNGRDFVQITCNTNHVTGNPRANYNLASVALGTVDSGATASIVAYPNGWRRLSFTVVSAITSINFLVSTITSSTAARFESFAGDITKGFYIWGYSVEAGAFPTSYIPTTTDAVTRSASFADLVDAAIANNIRSFYAEFRSPAVGTRGVVSLNDNSANERASLITSGTDPKLVVVDGGSTQADIDGGTVSAGTLTRVACRIDANSFAISINGASPVTDTSGTLPTVDRIMFGRTQAGEYLNGPLGRFTGWSQALSDARLQALGA